ncbi:MAG: beta-ribofuranosylaminobenzene 5'-phosphate synthase family protein [Gammaproteobacteria bacterium]
MNALPAKVTVLAPARLHMGFIDLSASLGRHFGSIGMALNEIHTRITLSSAPQFGVSGPAAERALRCTPKLCAALRVSDKLQIDIASAIPEHIGLGSGTQMSLAIGMGLNALYGLGLSVRDIAVATQRGARSGIGIGVFEQGGLVLDGGRGEHTLTPPMIARMAIPDDWRFMLVFDARGKGLHGEQEIRAFDALPPFPADEAARFCYLLLMQGLPALAEHDLESFGDVITQLQQAVGEHFARAQGGVFTSTEVGEAIQWLAGQGAVALGQTSWGPTGFCAIKGIERAEILHKRVTAQFAGYKNLSFMIVSARNSGAEVQTQLPDSRHRE